MKRRWYRNFLVSRNGIGLLGLLVLAIGYALGLRPRMIRWGATDEEVKQAYPGEDIIPGGTRCATNAVTIDAQPSRVWPWLIQMGTDRGGWYSWDILDNFGRKSADRIHPEWQQISVGDRFIAKPDGSEWWLVAALEPECFLCLRMTIDAHTRSFDPVRKRPRFYSDSTWCWLLEELPGNRTRIVESGYWFMEPHWLQPLANFFFLEPSHWIMQMRQFGNLKRRVESASSRTSERGATVQEQTAVAA